MFCRVSVLPTYHLPLSYLRAVPTSLSPAPGLPPCCPSVFVTLAVSEYGNAPPDWSCQGQPHAVELTTACLTGISPEVLVNSLSLSTYSTQFERSD